MRRAAWRGRRLALLTLMLAVAGLAALPPALGWLGRVRARHAMLTLLSREPMRTPQPIVLPEAAFSGTQDTAATMLAATIREQAVRGGVLIEQDAVRPAAALGLAARHIVVSGSARSILLFVEGIEQRSPVIRLSRYRVETTASGRALRLECDPVMAFTPR